MGKRMTFLPEVCDFIVKNMHTQGIATETTRAALDKWHAGEQPAPGNLVERGLFSVFTRVQADIESL